MMPAPYISFCSRLTSYCTASSTLHVCRYNALSSSTTLCMNSHARFVVSRIRPKSSTDASLPFITVFVSSKNCRSCSRIGDMSLPTGGYYEGDRFTFSLIVRVSFTWLRAVSSPMSESFENREEEECRSEEGRSCF